MQDDTTGHHGLSRRTVLRRGAILSTSLGLALATTTGPAGARTGGELIEAIASEAGISTRDAKRALDGFVGATTTALQKEGGASWARFGSFSISKRSARTGRNPRSGSRPGSGPANVVQFRPSEKLGAALNLVPRHRRRCRRRRRRREGASCPSDGTPIDAEQLAAQARIDRETAAAFLDAFVIVATSTLKKGDRLSLVGFGSFSISKRSARTGRNPQTGKEIKIPAKNVVKFKAGAELSKAVN